MTRRVDLIDQFTDLVVGADDPRRLAERTLEVVMSLLNGRAGAVFTCAGDDVTLFASRGIDQAVLDTVPAAWAVQKDALRRGETFYVPDRGSERRLPAAVIERSGPASFVIAPVLEEESLLALLYMDSQEPHFCDAHDIERLAKFSRIVAKSVHDTATPRPAGTADSWEAYLERTPVEDMEREKLLLLLNRNEWNIARVARMMGVTRRTVYLRLQRYNIPRERVPKSRSKSAS
ncbi:MAG TPA: helix-turn-helix domain-containing protein [Vicinamibacteria bacterium]|nr:helix-turn-helix domain-containing protein [Vicinamibacteria bacterium]